MKTIEGLKDFLAERWTVGLGGRNPDWDIDGPDDETNLYYVPISLEERHGFQMYHHFVDSDGERSFRAVTVNEVAEAVWEYLNG